MKIYLSCTANLGDFVNSFPVLSGLKKQYGQLDFVILDEMKKFKGIKEFLLYQDLFSDVSFDTEKSVENYIHLRTWSNNWDRQDQTNADRPIETCRYQNWLMDHYRLDFEVDDDFVLQVPDLDIEIKDKIYCGDRWSGPNIDTRRRSWTLQHLTDLEFLDYTNDLMTNAYIIKNCRDPFVSTFTGISGIADLLNKNQFVLYGPDIEYWDNKPISHSFKKHYYANRNSVLMSRAEFEEAIYGIN